MKLLLDEQVPRQLAASFPAEFDVRTVQQMGWAGTKNGQLLQWASDHKFVALVTADKNMEYQQNHAELSVMVIVLIAHGNRLQELEPLVPGILNVLNHNSDAGNYRVDA
jgi:predicted nuclease of predicted toxin-antitoxin system